MLWISQDCSLNMTLTITLHFLNDIEGLKYDIVNANVVNIVNLFLGFERC